MDNCNDIDAVVYEVIYNSVVALNYFPNTIIV
jgi:hypothetical protein